jgi:FkbM family methyltransferase
LQIGANDGRLHDPIYKLVTRHNLAGLAIEPLPDIFAELKENLSLSEYCDTQNRARVTLYRVPPGANVLGLTDVLRWIRRPLSVRVSTLRKSTLLVLSFQKKVPAEPLNRVLEDYGITDFDLLQVDAEGYDEEIVRMLLETKFRPNIISFERVLMSSKSFLDLGAY